MELDEFKTILNQVPAQSERREQTWTEQVLQNINNQAIVMKLRRSLRIELLFALAFMLFVLYTGLTSETVFVKLFAVLMSAFAVWFIAYVLKLYRKVSYDQVTAVSVRESLHNLIRIMDEFTRLYFQLTMIMIPVMVLLACFSVYLPQLPFSNQVDVPFPAGRFLAFVGLSSVWFVLMYFATKWYLKNLYGGYLASLKKNLRELEQDE
jgi:hypothetical protein